MYKGEVVTSETSQRGEVHSAVITMNVNNVHFYKSTPEILNLNTIVYVSVFHGTRVCTQLPIVS